jgi:hypothetical protein
MNAQELENIDRLIKARDYEGVNISLAYNLLRSEYDKVYSIGYIASKASYKGMAVFRIKDALFWFQSDGEKFYFTLECDTGDCIYMENDYYELLLLESAKHWESRI